MNRACPICEAPIVKGKSISWSFVFNGEPSVFSIDLCGVDHSLCEIYPTLRAALMRSEVVAQMLRQAYRE